MGGHRQNATITSEQERIANLRHRVRAQRPSALQMNKPSVLIATIKLGRPGPS